MSGRLNGCTAWMFLHSCASTPPVSPTHCHHPHQVDEKLKDALQHDIDRYAPGIEIISVRVTKPRIPEPIMANYIAMEVERTNVLVAMENQKFVQRQIEIERTKALAEVRCVPAWCCAYRNCLHYRTVAL